jgi:catechol 2,3-dioxygenase-like lactoylglutathione lyase family enzyme
MKIEHFAINVEKPTEMVNWYVEHLGMRVVRANNDANQTYFIVDDAGVVVVEVYNNPASPMPDYRGMNPLMFHIAFSVADMQPEIDRLVVAGATQEIDINTTPAGDQLVFLRDPWGVPLQLAQRAQPLL